MAKSFVDSIPGHYWALVFVIIVIVLDAAFFGNLKNLFRSKKSKQKHPRSSSRKNGDTDSQYAGQRLILKRNGSMFFNEEGDLAHEFWEEQNGKLVKVTKGLRKQGPVTLAIPTINPSLSVVLQCMVKEDGPDQSELPPPIKEVNMLSKTTQSTPNTTSPLPTNSNSKNSNTKKSASNNTKKTKQKKPGPRKPLV